MLYDDTIAAIATPPGTGALGIVRLSGKETLDILERCFRPRRSGPMRHLHMRYGHIVDAQGSAIDEVLAVYMRTPHSFTAEDSAEISCHGGPLVLRQVLERTLECGARLAAPGEYTLRAFLNGRIDLTQAEATLDVINARTEAGLALAQAQLGGWLAQALQDIRQELMASLAYLTALIDFPEDEVEAQPVVEPLTRALAKLNRLIDSAAQGVVLREGARAALIGRPNAGKSSLMNALLRMERAIVTAIPGTTRDTLEETANMAGVPVVLIDTAGITESDNLVERIGVERSRQALQAADIALLVVDASTAPGPADQDIAALTLGRPTVLVLNKVDLVRGQGSGVRGQETRRHETRDPRRDTISCVPPGQNDTPTTGRAADPRRDPISCAPPGQNDTPMSLSLGRSFDAVVYVSALSGEGIDSLAESIAQVLLGGRVQADTQLLTNPRHREALGRAAAHVQDAITSHAMAAHHELQAMDIIAALGAIGELTGEQVDRDLLDTIFSMFCIGK